MPLYEYQCDVCGRRFEKIQKFSDPPIEVCPTCGGKVHKLISSPAFHLKGTGWYATDYPNKAKGHASESESDSKTGAASAGSETAKSGESKDTKDSKPAAESKPSSDAGGSKDAGAAAKESKPAPPPSKS